MKRIFLPLIGILFTATLMAQTHTEKISREFALEKKSPDNTLIVANINGDVKVISYEGDKIVVEVTKTIRAKTDARLEKGKSEIQLGVIDRVDTLVLFVEDNPHIGKIKLTEQVNRAISRSIVHHNDFGGKTRLVICR